MATTRSKKSGDSKPVEKKQVEAPQVEEAKEAPKPVEKKAAAPKPLRKDNLFEKYLKNQSIEIDRVINFKSNFNEKEILLYVPPRQMLPNNPIFKKVISDKCKKLVIFSKGLTLVLSDDFNLKINLATELASKHGKRVILETIPSNNLSLIHI